MGGNLTFAARYTNGSYAQIVAFAKSREWYKPDFGHSCFRRSAASPKRTLGTVLIAATQLPKNGSSSKLPQWGFTEGSTDAKLIFSNENQQVIVEIRDVCIFEYGFDITR